MSGEPTRARYPDEEGYVEREGVRVFWKRYRDEDGDVVLIPGWPMSPARVWKAQIPYLGRSPVPFNLALREFVESITGPAHA